MEATTAAAHSVQSGIVTQAQGVSRVSEQALAQNINGLVQLSTMPADVQKMIVGRLNQAPNMASDEDATSDGDNGVQLRMNQAEDDIVDIVMFPRRGGDLGDAPSAMLTDLPPTPNPSVQAEHEGTMRPPQADSAEADISLANSSALELDQGSATDGFSFVSAAQYLENEEGEDSFEIVELTVECCKSCFGLEMGSLCSKFAMIRFS